jgi:hypothetical protein
LLESKAILCGHQFCIARDFASAPIKATRVSDNGEENHRFSTALRDILVVRPETIPNVNKDQKPARNGKD